jgi:hypothetical protein
VKAGGKQSLLFCVDVELGLSFCREIWIEDILEKGAEGKIWVQETGNNRRTERIS